MKKNYLSMLTVMMAAMLSVCFVSCKNDGDNPVTNEAEKFIGGWDDYFLFFADGTCKKYLDMYEGAVLGEWSYDENNKQLATTLDGNSWTISLITDNAWTGFSTKEGQSKTYNRNNTIYLEVFMDMMSGWSSDLGQNLEQGYGFYKTYMRAYSGWITATNDDIKITKDVIKASNISIHAINYSNNEKTVFTGSIIINNYGKKNANMKIEGTNTTTGGTFNKDYTAATYIKDKKVVSVNE